MRAIDAAHGGGFYAVPDAARRTISTRRSRRSRGIGPVVDVQTHLVDPARWTGPGADALAGFLRMADPDRWTDAIDPTHDRRRGVGRAACSARRRPRSRCSRRRPGRADVNVLTNRQIAAARDVVDRYAGTGRVLDAHDRAPEPRAEPSSTRWSTGARRCGPSGWKCYTLWGPPTKASPTGGWFLDDEEIGFPFLERVRALGPRVVATHKGIGGPIPEASVAAASPRDIGPAAAAFPDITFVVYHSGYERNPARSGGRRTTRDAPTAELQGVDRLVRSLADAGIGHRRQRVRRARDAPGS